MQRLALRYLQAMVFVLGALVFASCGSEASTSTPTPTGGSQLTGFEAEWARLIDAAQDEGEVALVLGGGDEAHLQEAFDVFEEQFGIRVRLTLGSGSENATRVLAERNNGLYTQDVSFVGRSSVQRFIEAGALIPMRPELFPEIVEEESAWLGGVLNFTDPEEKYVVVTQGEIADSIGDILYNTRNVSQAEIDALKSVWDLTDTDWQWVTLDPARSGTTAQLINWYIHPEAGPEWLRAFILGNQDNITNLDSDFRAVVDGLAQGKYDFAWMVGDARFQLLEAMQQGLPIGVLGGLGAQPVAAIISSRSPALFNNAPHPNAAKLFVNWYVSREGQDALQKSGATPFQSLRTDIGNTGRVDPSRLRQPGVDYVLIQQKELNRNPEATRYLADLYREAGLPVFGDVHR